MARILSFRRYTAKKAEAENRERKLHPCKAGYKIAVSPHQMILLRRMQLNFPNPPYKAKKEAYAQIDPVRST